MVFKAGYRCSLVGLVCLHLGIPKGVLYKCDDIWLRRGGGKSGEGQEVAQNYLQAWQVLNLGTIW